MFFIWKNERSVFINETLLQGLDEIKKLVSILNKYPLLEFIPIDAGSVPEHIYNVISCEHCDGYEKLLLAKYMFPDETAVEVCLGRLPDDPPGQWNLVDAAFEWRERMLAVAGDAPVRIKLEKCHIGTLFTASELKQMRDSEAISCDNEIAECEYYQHRAGEIVDLVTEKMAARLKFASKESLFRGKFVTVDPREYA